MNKWIICNLSTDYQCTSTTLTPASLQKSPAGATSLGAEKGEAHQGWSHRLVSRAVWVLPELLTAVLLSSICPLPGNVSFQCRCNILNFLFYSHQKKKHRLTQLKVLRSYQLYSTDNPFLNMEQKVQINSSYSVSTTWQHSLLHHP